MTSFNGSLILEVGGSPVEDVINRGCQAGNFDYVDPDIDFANFPVSAGTPKRREIRIFDPSGQPASAEDLGQAAGHLQNLGVNLSQLKGFPSSQAAISLMQEDGFQPASAEEVLTLGANSPWWEKGKKIVALGSVDSEGQVIMLSHRGHEKRIVIGGRIDGGVWDSDCFFAGAKEAA